MSILLGRYKSHTEECKYFDRKMHEIIELIYSCNSAMNRRLLNRKKVLSLMGIKHKKNSYILEKFSYIRKKCRVLNF